MIPSRVSQYFPFGKDLLASYIGDLVCVWLRDVACTQWGNKRYMNMAHFETWDMGSDSLADSRFMSLQAKERSRQAADNKNKTRSALYVVCPSIAFAQKWK